MSEPVTESIIVRGPVPRVYGAWADPEVFPRFLQRLKQVRKTGDRTYQWTLEAPKGDLVEGDVELTRLEDNKRVAWCSTGGELQTSGQVTFNSLPHHETQVTVTCQFQRRDDPGAEPTSLAGDREQEILAGELRSFKKFFESDDSGVGH